MKRNLGLFTAAILGLCLWKAGAAGPEAGDTLVRVDALYDKAVEENYRAEGFALMKESLDICEGLLEANPSSYDLLWRSARTAVGLGETAKILKRPDWKELGASLAKKSIGWTEAAKNAEPGRVEGYFWQMKAMGLVYETKGVMAFAAMGYVSRSRKNMDACCAIDPSYMDYSPVLARALYFFTAPPLFGRDIAGALAGYTEFAAKTHWSFEPYRQYAEAARLLMSANGKEGAQSARALLLAALADPTPRPYYYELAAALLAKLDTMSR